MLIGINGRYFPAICRVCLSIDTLVLVGHKLLSYINSESHGNAISVSNVNIDLYYDYVAKNIVNGEASPKTSATAAVLTNNQVPTKLLRKVINLGIFFKY